MFVRVLKSIMTHGMAKCLFYLRMKWIYIFNYEFMV
jgi:3-phenylpropionate/cinnamic acid dioxygenase small subunit